MQTDDEGLPRAYGLWDAVREVWLADPYDVPIHCPSPGPLWGFLDNLPASSPMKQCVVAAFPNRGWRVTRFIEPVAAPDIIATSTRPSDVVEAG